MPETTVRTDAPQMRGRWPRPVGVGAACAGFGGLTVGLIGLATMAMAMVVPHALQPVAHRALGVQPVSGLAALLFAIGASLRWSVAGNGAHLTGTLRAGSLVHTHPVLLIGPVLVAAAVLVTGWLAARHAIHSGRSAARAAAGAAAGFALLSATAAIAVSRASVALSPDLTARVHVDALSTFLLGAAWGGIGASAGWMLAVRRLPHLPAVMTLRRRAVGPISGVIVSGALLIALVSPIAAPAATAAASPAPTAAAPSTTVMQPATTSSSTPGTTTSSAGAAPSTTATRHTTTIRGTTSTTARAGAVASGTVASTASASHVEALGLQPPAPGTYTYTTSGSAKWGLGSTVFPNTSTLVVDPAANGRQHSRRQVLTAAGQGFVIDQWLEYGSTGIRVGGQLITTTFNGSTTVRDLKTPTTQLFLSPTPTAGEHHEFDLASPVVSAHEVVDVLRVETVSIGGQNVSAAVVRTVLHLGGTATGTLEFDQWFDMARRIVVKETSAATVKASVVTLNSNYNATLQRLTPS
jgi:hypothetical protein